MGEADSQGRGYTRVAIALHWIIAAMILANFILVWTAHDAPKAEEQRLVGLHMSTGLMILVLSVARIVWRLMHPAPPLEETLKRWEVILAKSVHHLFYFLIIAIPLTGWLMVSAFSGGHEVSIYGIFPFPGLPLEQSKETAGEIHEVHELLAGLMFLLFLIHTAAALKHWIFDRDGTMARMAPFLKS